MAGNSKKLLVQMSKSMPGLQDSTNHDISLREAFIYLAYILSTPGTFDKAQPPYTLLIQYLSLHEYSSMEFQA